MGTGQKDITWKWWIDKKQWHSIDYFKEIFVFQDFTILIWWSVTFSFRQFFSVKFVWSTKTVLFHADTIIGANNNLHLPHLYNFTSASLPHFMTLGYDWLDADGQY